MPPLSYLATFRDDYSLLFGIFSGRHVFSLIWQLFVPPLSYRRCICCCTVCFLVFTVSPIYRCAHGSRNSMYRAFSFVVIVRLSDRFYRLSAVSPKVIGCCLFSRLSGLFESPCDRPQRSLPRAGTARPHWYLLVRFRKKW